MQAAVFSDTGQIAVIERALPEPRPGWVRLAVTAVGICGSDLNLLYAHGGASRGVQPGHEVAGIVDAVGEGVELAPGTNVALEPLVGCGACSYCRRGLHNLCPTVRLCGFTRPGGMAEFVSVPAAALHPVPTELSPEIAALAEPMAVCVRGVRLGNIGLHERVAILGAGSIGLLTIRAARAAGASEILITARHAHQRDMALALGADRVFADSDALLREVGDQHVDVVVETVGGRADTLAEAVGIARRGGRIVLLGVFDADCRLPGLAFFTRELTLRGSNCYGRECHEGDFHIGCNLVQTDRAALENLVTHRFKLDQVAEAFATAADKSTRSIKVQIQP